MFLTKWTLGKEDFSNILKLRTEVCVEEFGKPAEEEFGVTDEYAAHLYVYMQKGDAIGCGRMYPQGNAVVIDRIVTAKAYRPPQKFEDLLIRMMLYKAQSMPFEYIVVQCSKAQGDALLNFGFERKRETDLGEDILVIPIKNIVWHSDCKHS